MQVGGHCSYEHDIKAEVNTILRVWRHLWPGGLGEAEYSKLNLIAHCRHGELGSNRATCRDCHAQQWFASSCGDRHCPKCLGPRQAKWSQEVCGRLPDCPHFHVVFTVPEEFHAFFAANYRLAADVMFAAAAETLAAFQRREWGAVGASLAVLHTWGRALTLHPHLHLLVSAGGRRLADGTWVAPRKGYLFPVRALSKVFRGIMLRKLEELDAAREVAWPERQDTLEARRDWRLRLAARGWNVFARPTLGNTRAVVRYLAAYTSRIAISNRRITAVDEQQETVSFEWKDYRDGRTKEMTLPGGEFIRRYSSHLVPAGFRRIRCYGLLAGRKGEALRIPGGPARAVGERDRAIRRPACPRCGGGRWRYDCLYQTRRAFEEGWKASRSPQPRGPGSCSLGAAGGEVAAGWLGDTGPPGAVGATTGRPPPGAVGEC